MIRRARVVTAPPRAVRLLHTTVWPAAMSCPATRRPGDPATRRPGDPATRRPGVPPTRRLIGEAGPQIVAGHDMHRTLAAFEALCLAAGHPVA
ncbi:hypothetical protein PV729_11495 [Streptomyces europaeiscabiei]|uniref:Uncharacterized protein n=1 Tax=Streptomyces europaeiscabiei TaxID=146819 RepID=A0ABU4NDN0_9ACTN|nr:hypothetical protein [Streptomyces europaeiscabiei]MDX3544144.1 hypothetical protein [Streptomyces europaeiscabiei]MDX3552378.1 hypothetical protein [Streptomyces europaeiscabiei]MDX3701170.1 hypothetical protein [Streptomyces europaeiscabiei]